MPPTDLYLVRHAIAAERGDEWPDDTKRPLTKRGISRFRECVTGLRELEAAVDEIFTSPLVRAKQTADILAAGMDGKPPEDARRPRVSAATANRQGCVSCGLAARMAARRGRRLPSTSWPRHSSHAA